MSYDFDKASLDSLCKEFSPLQMNNGFMPISDGNVFSVLDITGKEVMYCRVLLYLLKNNWHSFEKDVLGNCCNGEELISAETEHPCSQPCSYYGKEGRIDIFLKTQSHVVAIEVKVDAGDQEHQLIRYQKELENSFKGYNRHIFYLTLDGHDASDNSLTCNQECKEKTKCAVKSYKRISFCRNICRWLKNLVSDYEEHSIAKDFLEVLKMSDNNYQEYVKLLKQSPEYPKMILELSEAIPSFFADVREAFLNEIAEKLKEKEYGFQDDNEAPHEYKREIWPVNLKKDGKCLHFCYETNFFFRTGIGEEWQYLKANVFSLKSEDVSFLSRKSNDAFNVKVCDQSSFGLLDWFYEKDENKEKIIRRCALAAKTFFE